MVWSEGGLYSFRLASLGTSLQEGGMGGRVARAKLRKFASFYHVSAKPSSVLCDNFLFYVMMKQSAAGRSFRSAPPRRKYGQKKKL